LDLRRTWHFFHEILGFDMNPLHSISHRCAALLVAVSCCVPAGATEDPAQILMAKFSSLESRLRTSPMRRPMVLESSESQNKVLGEVYAVINYPFAEVNTGLNHPDHLCDVMSLHINIKYCRAGTGPNGTTLKVNVGKKTPEDLKDAPRIEFKYTVRQSSAQYLDFELASPGGPMGTRDYRIALEAIPVAADKTFLHFTYAYVLSFTSRIAMQTYLATFGLGKVGFTPVGKSINGQVQMVGGIQAVVERNTMRYFLAIDSFLGAAASGATDQLDARLQRWHAAVEQYPRQLHDLEHDEYIAMKRDEYRRQQTIDY
jgi:hypothetical protein